NLASTEAQLTEKTLEDIKGSQSLVGSHDEFASQMLPMVFVIRLLDNKALHCWLGKRVLCVLRKVTSGVRWIGSKGWRTNKLTNGIVEDPETERLRLRKELADARRAQLNAEEKAHKLERLVTQLRSNYNGHNTNGPDSLPSEPEHEPNARIRRTSLNSSNNSTVVFGPVTDL
ncbi:Enoyl-(Acyl carrier) reductase family protein, partial [Operophtera brumata]